MNNLADRNPNTRIGFHYFPDTVHYRETDLQRWLPELLSLGASWLVLTASPDRAIPEKFIGQLVEKGIEPVLHFKFSLSAPPKLEDLRVLLESYARWGVRYVILFDRPNDRSSWSLATWTQEDLVERFLDRFLPVAECVLQSGLIPVFPPLEPGGNYWDTSFLRAALQSLLRRRQNGLLDRLVLGAYGWTGEHPLDWGSGGPERWPGARPYFTPANEEDQRGFRICDWYIAISSAVLSRPLPILMLGVGQPWDPRQDHHLTTDELPANHGRDVVLIARLLAGEEIDAGETYEKDLEPVPAEVIGACFWLFGAAPESPYIASAWFKPDGSHLPAVDGLRGWITGRGLSNANATVPSENRSPILHYLLLPMYEWGVCDWHLDIIRPFVKKYQPTVGFSLAEARHAARVTVIGGPQHFSEDALSELRSVGCLVERITGDGTSIASILAER